MTTEIRKEEKEYKRIFTFGNNEVVVELVANQKFPIMINDKPTGDYREGSLLIIDMLKKEGFIKKSIQYPMWWGNIGTGYPRTWYLNLLLPIGRYYRDRQNPINKLYHFIHSS